MTKKYWISLLHARQMQGDLCHADVERVFKDEATAKSFTEQHAHELTVEVDGNPCYAQRSVVSVELEDVRDRIWIVFSHARQVGGTFCHTKVEEVLADEAAAGDYESFKPKEYLVEIDGVNCLAVRRVVPYNLTQE